MREENNTGTIHCVHTFISYNNCKNYSASAQTYHHINDDVKSIKEKRFLIIFSDPAEIEIFKAWIQQNGGSYGYI